MKQTGEKIVAIYVRVSTGYQVDKDSLPFQKKELKAYCEHILHRTNFEVFEDAGKSGKNTERPAFQRMMKKIRNDQVSHVLVYKIDRVSRNLVDFSVMYDEFKQHRVTFVSMSEQFDTSSAIGEAVLKIILVFAELERKMTSERVTAVMIGRANEKKWNGARMPFGWRWNAEKEMPEHDPDQVDDARMLYEVYDRTHSTSQVRDYLYDHDIKTKRGGRWTTTTIANFLRNPMNKGDYRYNYRNSARGQKKPENEVIYLENVFDPLVSPELWDRVSKIMDENNEKKRLKGRTRQDKNVHVFAGLLRCADCGAGMQAVKLDKMRANGFQPSLYVCTSRRTYRACNAPYASEVNVGPFVFNFISNIIKLSGSRKKINSAEDLERILLSGEAFKDIRCIDPTDLDVIYQAIKNPAAGSASYIPAPLKTEGQSDIADLKAEEAKLQRALERLKKIFLFDETAMPENEYLSTRADLQEQLTRIRNKIADSEEDAFQHISELSFVNSASSFLVSYRIQSGEEIDYPTFAAAVDPQVLKDFVNLIIDHVTMKDANPVEIVFKNGLKARFVRA